MSNLINLFFGSLLVMIKDKSVTETISWGESPQDAFCRHAMAEIIAVKELQK